MRSLLLGVVLTAAVVSAPAVDVETTQGRFTLEVHPEWAPLGAARFLELVKARYFADSRFFRVRAGYIAQFGIAGAPAVAQAWRAKTIPDDPVTQSNKRGFAAFAMTGEDTRTTQIYINLADNVRLDAQGFAPFARVVEGMQVVDKLYSGYGESSGGGMRTGKQDPMFAEGNAWLDREFPKLDRLLTVRIRYFCRNCRNPLTVLLVLLLQNGLVWHSSFGRLMVYDPSGSPSKEFRFSCPPQI